MEKKKDSELSQESHSHLVFAKSVKAYAGEKLLLTNDAGEFGCPGEAE